MSTAPVQIVATIGPSSFPVEILEEMMRAGVSVARLNFAWSDSPERAKHIAAIHALAEKLGTTIPIMQDLPGPRLQQPGGHSYDPTAAIITPEDELSIAFGAEHHLEYAALSFIGSGEDVRTARQLVEKHQGTQKLIAKIERKQALDTIDDILTASDGIMIARGDLASEVPLEEIPFIEMMLIQKAHTASKPVIVATQMLESMLQNATPTRAEVTDVAFAVMQGADAVMLSEETATGNHPVEAVAFMNRIVRAAQAHVRGGAPHPL